MRPHILATRLNFFRKCIFSVRPTNEDDSYIKIIAIDPQLSSPDQVFSSEIIKMVIKII
jgi:hypothetical protein